MLRWVQEERGIRRGALAGGLRGKFGREGRGGKEGEESKVH